MDIIFDEANACLTTNGKVNLENKVVLSIAIRIAAERFMLKKIADSTFAAGIEGNQTPTLLKKFGELFSGETEVINTLQKVVLMTPENIHLNSFMYEPILDMSDEHLRKLFGEVVALN